MRVHVSHVLTAVGVDDVCAVDRQRLIRVDGNQNNTYIIQRGKVRALAAICRVMTLR